MITRLAPSARRCSGVAQDFSECVCANEDRLILKLQPR
jgi:hypothetical protein